MNLPGFTLVPPLPFLTASAACSALRAAGLLHPAADHGVRQVVGLGRGSACSSCRLSGLCRPPLHPSMPRCGHCWSRHVQPKLPVQARLARSLTRHPTVAGDVPGTPEMVPNHGPCSLALHPSKSFPPSQLVRVTAYRCPLAVDSSGPGPPPPPDKLLAAPNSAPSEPRPRGFAP